MSETKQAIQDILRLTAFFALSYAALYLFNVLIARLFLPAVYGDISIILRVLKMGSPIFIQGGIAGAVFYIPEYLKKRYYPTLLGYIHWSTKRILFSFLFLVGLVFLTFFMVYLPPEYVAYDHPVWFALGLVPLFSIMLWLASLLKSIKFFSVASFLSEAFFYILTCLLLLLIVKWMGYATLAAAVLAIAGASLIIILLELVLLFIYSPSINFKQPKVYEEKEWRKRSLVLLGSGVLNQIIPSIDLFMTEVMSVQQVDVGIIAAIIVIAGIMWQINAPIVTVMKVYVAEYRDDLTKLQSMVHRINFVKLLINTTVFVLLLVFYRQILGHFGSEFLRGASVLRDWLIVSYICSFMRLADAFLVQTEHVGLFNWVQIISILSSIVLGVLLIPHYGLVGVLWTFSIVTFSARVLKIIIVKRELRVKLLFVL